MNSRSDNPWASRYEPLLDKAIIKKRALVTVPEITGIRDMSTELACARLEIALKSVFYPTTQCVDILHRFVDMAYAHCVINYPDHKAFLAGVYARNSPLPEFFQPILLTGLAGTGKTQIMKAFRRIQVEDSQIIVEGEHSPFPLRGSGHITVQARSTPSDILSGLAQSVGKPSDLVEKCKKIVFQDGIPFLIADEFQFLTGSQNANTKITQMLFLVGYVGIPWCYNANYSLVERLLKRPEEDRQRLLPDPEFLLPDPPSSEDWQQTLKAQKNVAPKILTFDPIENASVIHAYTFGRKRATVKLLSLALRNEHPRNGTVDIAAIKRAFHSSKYASYREEAEILTTQAIQNKQNKKKKDLWCPLPLPPDAAERFLKLASEVRTSRVAEAELMASLNGEERKAVCEIERDLKKEKKQLGDVVPIRKKKVPLTADDLKKNANWFKDQI
jgi:hypothetical protein